VGSTDLLRAGPPGRRARGGVHADHGLRIERAWYAPGSASRFSGPDAHGGQADGSGRRHDSQHREDGPFDVERGGEGRSRAPGTGPTDWGRARRRPESFGKRFQGPRHGTTERGAQNEVRRKSRAGPPGVEARGAARAALRIRDRPWRGAGLFTRIATRWRSQRAAGSQVSHPTPASRAASGTDLASLPDPVQEPAGRLSRRAREPNSSGEFQRTWGLRVGSRYVSAITAYV
jgi:hypothetical protein